MYCLKCGALLGEKYLDGRFRDICLNCGWVYYPQLKVSSAVIIESDQKILLLKRAYEPWKDFWYLPAGYVEADEDPKTAAVREVKEEIGIEVETTALFDHYYFEDDPRGNGLLLVFNSRIIRLSLQPSNEIKEYAFFKNTDLPKNLCGAGHKLAILSWVRLNGNI